MRHDFEDAARGAVMHGSGKTRVNMFMDNDIVAHFRALAAARGRGYQTEINAALRQVMAQPPRPPEPPQSPQSPPAAAMPPNRRVRLLDARGKDVLVDMAARMRVLEQRAGVPGLAVFDERAEYVVEIVEPPRKRAASKAPASKARAPKAKARKAPGRLKPSASKDR